MRKRLCWNNVTTLNYCHNVSLVIYHNSNIMFKFYGSVKTNRTILHMRHAWHFKQIRALMSQVIVTRGKVREGGAQPDTRI